MDFRVSSLISLQSSGLPLYIPQLQHRYLRRSRLLDAEIVAIPLFHIVGKRRGGGYGLKYSSARELRLAYKLKPNTKILLVGVDDDAPLEKFWAEHLVTNVCRALAGLDIIGVTVPNFSYFTCVPRFQILRNRKRILLTAERLSSAGVKVSPHLNGNTPADWDFWLRFLREHPEVETATVEFQTGARADGDVGKETFESLVLLLEKLGRPLHLFLVGAGRFAKEAWERIESFSIVDSQPFMQALARQVLSSSVSGGWEWSHSPTAPGAHLDDLVETNLVHYPEKLFALPGVGSNCPSVIPNQDEFDWQTSSPYLTAQPSAPVIPEMNLEATSPSHASS
jgi:hypothetical protein